MSNVVANQIQSFIQTIYQYRLSVCYKIHLALIICLGLLIMYLSIRQWNCRNQAFRFKDLKVSQKKSDAQYSEEVDRQTTQQVRKLRESPQYRNYLEDKNRPNSNYNRYIELDQIVFSDQEDDESYQQKIYGQTQKTSKIKCK